MGGSSNRVGILKYWVQYYEEDRDIYEIDMVVSDISLDLVSGLVF